MSATPGRALVAREGALAVVSVNRPEARNALDGETLDALALAFAELEDDTDIRCAIRWHRSSSASCVITSLPACSSSAMAR